uniref:Sperm flagellar protein 1-like n=1 Tax=Ictidomys tridecemlineatus TaxID=43179 RepID=A0A287CV07_ICTTR
MPGSDRRSPAALGPPPDALRGLCAWLDQLPLSRPKRHLTRDFSDGVLVAEIVKHFHPRLVDLHSYIPACNTDQKLSNWSLLNRQGLQRVSKPTHIDLILCALREKGKAGNKFPAVGARPFSVPLLSTDPHPRPRAPGLSLSVWVCFPNHSLSKGTRTQLKGLGSTWPRFSSCWRTRSRH